MAHRRRAATKKLQPGRVDLAVYRLNGRIRMLRLDRVERALLEELRKGATLNQVFQRMIEQGTKFAPEKIQHAFQRFASQGWIAVLSRRKK